MLSGHRMYGKYVLEVILLFRKKQIPCPVCGFRRLIDAEMDNLSELMPENKMPDGWHPDYFQKCPQCKKQIGIRKVG